MGKRPGVANAFAAGRDLASAFFANCVGLSRPSGIALLEIDHGIRRVEKHGVVRNLPLQRPRAVGLYRPAPVFIPTDRFEPGGAIASALREGTGVFDWRLDTFFEPSVLRELPGFGLLNPYQPEGSPTMRASVFASKLRRRRRMSLDVLEDRQLLATITVNTTADDTTAGATLSLRQAIEISDGTLSVSSLSTQGKHR